MISLAHDLLQPYVSLKAVLTTATWANPNPNPNHNPNPNSSPLFQAILATATWEPITLCTAAILLTIYFFIAPREPRVRHRRTLRTSRPARRMSGSRSQYGQYWADLILYSFVLGMLFLLWSLAHIGTFYAVGLATVLVINAATVNQGLGNTIPPCRPDGAPA